MGLLQKLLGRNEAPKAAPADLPIDVLYPEFCRTFLVRPGVTLMDDLRAKGETELIDWLRPETECAIVNSVIRFGVSATREGHKTWEKQGLSFYYNGNWTANGGLPPPESMAGLERLAQIIGKPITLFYTETEGGPIMKREFEP